MVQADVLHDVQGKPVGIVELEDQGARQGVPPLLFKAIDLLIKQLQAEVEGLQEAFFFLLNDLGGQGQIFPDLGIELPHGLGHTLSHPEEKGVIESQDLSVSGGPPQNATHHIAPTFIGGHGPIGQQKGQGPTVVGNDLDGNIRFSSRPMATPESLFNGPDDGTKEVTEKLFGTP